MHTNIDYHYFTNLRWRRQLKSYWVGDFHPVFAILILLWTHVIQSPACFFFDYLGGGGGGGGVLCKSFLDSIHSAEFVHAHEYKDVVKLKNNKKH